VIIHDVQQNSDEWLALRAGRPTASEFSKIVTSEGKPSKSMSGYAVTLAGELYAGRPLDAWEGNQWTERGHELEARALAWYEFMNDTPCARVGFVTDDSETYGCSPDAIADGNIVEVKSLKAENHIKALMYFEKHGKAPTDYIAQTQGQIMVCNAEYSDLIFFHDVLPPFVVRQGPIKAVQDGLAENIPKLIAERDRVLAILNDRKAATA